MFSEKWNGFKPGVWQDEINVRDFIQQNYTEYLGDSSFLSPITPRTEVLLNKCKEFVYDRYSCLTYFVFTKCFMSVFLKLQII